MKQWIYRCYRRLAVATLVVVFATTPGCGDDSGPPRSTQIPVDLIIRGGQVLDGLGNPAMVADLVVTDGRILAIEADAELRYQGARVIDATGKVVTPGFIDPHSHGDPLTTPAFENFLAMGVTTITLGQDGSSPEVELLSEWLDTISEKGIGPNLVMFVGHGTLRTQSGIGRDPAPSEAQLNDMLGRLDATLNVAFGLSTGLEYTPGLYAGEAELLAMARVVGNRNRLIMSHLRNEDDDQLEASIAELASKGQYARVHIAHLKSVYGQGTKRAEQILAQLRRLQAAGVQISADSYPYNASYAGVSLLFPTWAKTSEQFAEARRSRDEELATYLRTRVMARNGPDATLLGTEPFVGETLTDLAARFEMPFERVLIDVIGPQGGSAAYFVMNDALQSALLADPMIAVCSDGSPSGFHPRGHGTYAKVIETYVMDRQTLTLAEAVRKMTSLPAGIIGIDDRGELAPGKAADVLVFDPAMIRANATYVDPLQLAEGFDVVVINGQVARQKGVLSDFPVVGFPGQVLKPPENL